MYSTFFLHVPILSWFRPDLLKRLICGSLFCEVIHIQYMYALSGMWYFGWLDAYCFIQFRVTETDCLTSFCTKKTNTVLMEPLGCCNNAAECIYGSPLSQTD